MLSAPFTHNYQVAGSTLPFMSWFNERENKVRFVFLPILSPQCRRKSRVSQGWRILFFVCMAGSAIGPLAQLSFQKGPWAAGQFAKPLVPMLLSYLFGLSCESRFSTLGRASELNSLP